MRKLGAGRTSEVFELTDGRILKLLLPGFSDLAELELHNLRALERAGLQVPRSEGLMQIEDRTGIIFANIGVGKTLYEDLRSRPWRVLSGGRELARLHATIHAKSCDDLPSLRDQLWGQLDSARLLPAEIQRAGLDLLERLPDGSSVCHDDLHASNVILSDAGPVVIDWVRTARGAPLADVAVTLIKYWFREKRADGLGRLPRDFARLAFIRAYLRHYRQLCPHSPNALQRWLIPVAAAYAELRANTTQRAQILHFLKKQLALVDDLGDGRLSRDAQQKAHL